ncbi:MAG TPA: olefin beta-lactone synthetase [Xylella sp.]
MTDPCNIAAVLPRLARERPDQIAIRCPGRHVFGGMAPYDLTLSYRELDTRSDAIAAGLSGYGIGRGVRTVVMVRPSLEFFLLMFALFKAGAVPVLVDPGINRSALKQCLNDAEPQAFIGILLAQLARRLLCWVPSVTRVVTVGTRWACGGSTLTRLERAGAGADPQLADTAGDEVAAILFTSGSTGVPKGVVYRHRHFLAQVALLRGMLGIVPGGVDLATFPPFALFSPALGLTSIIPDMDPRCPARTDPRKLHDVIARFGVSHLFGSPALLRVLAKYGRPLPTLRCVTSAGAPVPPEVVAKIRLLLPKEAQLWTPYGATECLPVSVVESRELATTRAATERGAGTCVGHVMAPNVVRIIAINDEVIASWDEVHEMGVGEIGEITVSGPSATDVYCNRTVATHLAKIRERLADGRERIVHRMGDLGYFDAQCRLWFCGRKTHRVETVHGPLYTEQIEPVFNVIDGVRRTALVGIGPFGVQRPVLCYEALPGVDIAVLEQCLRATAREYPHTISIVDVLRHPRFPVDIRHNAKIGRERLAVWAAQRLAS